MQLIWPAGFTGAPAITVLDEGLSDIWSDLGRRWRTTEQYIKLWPVCRWAQPAMQAVFDSLSQVSVHPDEIDRIEIDTFHESLRLASPHPDQVMKPNIPFAGLWRRLFSRCMKGVILVPGII